MVSTPLYRGAGGRGGRRSGRGGGCALPRGAGGTVLCGRCAGVVRNGAPLATVGGKWEMENKLTRQDKQTNQNK